MGVILVWISRPNQGFFRQAHRSLSSKAPGLSSDQQPIIASLRDSTGAHLCSAILIAPKALLTAASCVAGGLKPMAHLGRLQQSDNEGNKELNIGSIQTVRTIVHPRHNGARYVSISLHGFACG